MDYYNRLDVRRAILNFSRAGNREAVREGAFYNPCARSVQRHFAPNELVILDSSAALDRALRAGGSAFYCSYWRYAQPQNLAHPFGRDLVWTVRATLGGLRFAKLVTAAVIEALADNRFDEPWVKYSGELGFDLVIPLEEIPGDAQMGGLKSLDDYQRALTRDMADYLANRFNFRVKRADSSLTIREGLDTCLLSELRVGRGLLLAPMSLNPKSGLVSVPLAPDRVASFSVLDASAADAAPYEWIAPKAPVRSLTPLFECRPNATLAEC